MPYKDKEKQREFQRISNASRRIEYIELFGGKCNKCPSKNDLEFDHVERSTKISHRIWSWSRYRIAEELGKCQLLCNKCHLSKTILENKKEVKHGTSSGYDYHGCRCILCKATKSNRNKLRRR